MVESFPMIPASARVLWLIIPVSILLVAVMIALLYSAHASRSVHFEVSAEGLQMAGDFWGREVTAASLDLRTAQPVNLHINDTLRPRWRTWGTGLPGYQSGWFRLRDGQKALVYLTDPTRVAYIPTREGYALLLSVADPERFIASLRETVVSQH